MIRGDILAMAQDVARAKPLFDSDRERFQQFLYRPGDHPRTCRWLLS